MMARTRALTAARSVGPDKLLEGHGDRHSQQPGDDGHRRRRVREPAARGVVPGHPAAAAPGERGHGPADAPRGALRSFEPAPGPDGEDSVPFSTGDGSPLGLLRFRFSCKYAHGTLLRDYFENEFANPNQAS